MTTLATLGVSQELFEATLADLIYDCVDENCEITIKDLKDAISKKRVINFAHDLYLDSLDMIGITLLLEEKFNVQFDDYGTDKVLNRIEFCDEDTDLHNVAEALFNCNLEKFQQ